MYIDKGTNKFTPIKIVIETQEEAEHLMYRLCVCECKSDPKGIEAKMRELILDGLRTQGVDFSGYPERETKLSNEYYKK